MKATNLYTRKTIFNRKDNKNTYFRGVILFCLMWFSALSVNAQTNGLDFAGTLTTGSYVTVPNSPSLTAGTELTFEAWVNIPSAEMGNIVMKGDYGWGLMVGNDGCSAGNKLNYWVFAACPMSITSTGSIPNGVWTHVAIVVTTFPTKTLEFFINGVSAGYSTDASISIGNGSAGSLFLGKQGSSCFCNFFNGTMDEVRVWNVARTQAQIAANMNSDIPQQAGLVAYYRFDQGTAGGNNTTITTLQDYSGNNNCGTLNNFALTGATSNFVTGTNAFLSSTNPISLTVPASSNTGTLTVCTGNTTTLSNAVTGGTWSSSNTGVATVNPTTGVVSGVSAGTANITYILNCGTAISQVTVNTTPTITSSGNTAICNGTSIGRSAFGGATYTWSPAAGLSATVGSTVTANPSATTTYTITGTSSLGCSNTTSLTVTVNPVPSVTLSAIPAICAGTTSATQAFTGATEVISKSATFTFSGSVQTWTVPTGITSITVDAYGAAGGVNSDMGTYFDREGYGARVQTALAVTPGQVLNIYVGGKGAAGISGAGGSGGYNGGGNGNFGFAPYAGGGGGGATDIRIGGTSLTDRKVVAAGGGGAGLNCGSNQDRGGDGGGFIGEDGLGCGWTPGTGGTASTGGVPGGLFGTGGDGLGGSAGGGGGGGYYGGGGGQWSGAGGGSSYTDAMLSSSITHTRGANPSAGFVTISYQIPTTYNLVWGPAATLQGFSNVTGAGVTASPITIAVPGSAAAASYTGTLTMTNSITGCVTTGQPVSLTINPIPDVSPVSSQTVCNTVSTSAITFTTTVPGTVFNWTNPNPGIGLLGSGTGDIASFTAVNTSFVPVTTVFTVTPTRLGCVGSIQTFSITVNPTPNVAASLNQEVCNGFSTSAVVFTGPVAGTTYSWTNDNTSIGLASSGTGNIGSFIGTNSTAATESGVVTVSTSANGCSGGSNSFTITVYPTPTLSTTLNPPAICDNTLFSYPPASATTGTAFDWSRDVVAGITNPMNTGSDDPLEILMSDTTDPINVAYVYTLTANGCTNSQTVSVVVNPTPMLTSPLTPAAICDSTEFAYAHTSLTAGTTYSWSRDFVSGISNAAQSGMGDISEYLDNTTPNPIPVVYMDTLMANGCINIQSVTVTVNPKPELSTATVLSAICDSSSIFYVPNSLTTGTTYAWNRAALAGTAAATGIDTISGTLYNNTVNPVTIVHTYTLTANGCTNTQDVSIVVYPTPKLNSSLTPPALCDSQIFNYTPMSGTLGAAFAWSRPFVLGIGVPASSGTGNPNEQMINNTHGNLNVTYVYTTTANGCTHVQHVVVAVRPTPRLSTPLTGSICSGVNYHYKPTGYTFGSTFAWARASVSGIRPNTGAGTGVIDEVLVNDTLKPITTAYKFTVTANGCSHTQYLVVTVNPAPAAVGITTYPPSALCTNTIGQNFGTSAVPPAGQQYKWTATNATVWSTGDKGQYCLVNFDTPGEAWVTLNSNVTGIACITKSSYKVNVGTSVAGMPKVVYFDGQLVCLDPTQNSYQWGFDDKLTLDSTIVAGEKNPNYFISGPDFVYRHYWVITEKDGCIQKSYYNAPLAISEVSADVANIKLYPNPANSLLNVEIQTTIDGKYELDVVNLLGQTLYKEKVDGQRARVDVTNFAPGIYLVDCYRDGVKIATQRFIKN